MQCPSWDCLILDGLHFAVLAFSAGFPSYVSGSFSPVVAIVLVMFFFFYCELLGTLISFGINKVDLDLCRKFRLASLGSFIAASSERLGGMIYEFLNANNHSKEFLNKHVSLA